MVQALSKNKQAGFTLIEISIVLVIIGLLLGGVLKGQALIHNAKISSLARDAEAYSAAISTYREKFNALPGDDSQAEARWSGAVGVTNGSGNGVLSNDTERQNVIAHLAAADLVKGVSGMGTQWVTHKLNGQIRFYTNSATAGGGFPLAMCYTGLAFEDAEELDRRFDGIADGTRGSVRRSNQTAYAATGNMVCISI